MLDRRVKKIMWLLIDKEKDLITRIDIFVGLKIRVSSRKNQCFLKMMRMIYMRSLMDMGELDVHNI